MVRNPAPVMPGRRGWAALLLIVLMPGLFGAQTAWAQPDADDRTSERAEHIVTQPARDVGIAKDKIAPVLQQAVEATYAMPEGHCRAITAELAELDDALGPDFDNPPERGDDQLTRLAEAGGEMVVNSFIPFRGIVREVTGAAAADRRKRAAINAGIARRGFLRGLARARHCRLPVSPPAPVTSSAK